MTNSTGTSFQAGFDDFEQSSCCAKREVPTSMFDIELATEYMTAGASNIQLATSDGDLQT
jgi:hypothetical protein